MGKKYNVYSIGNALVDMVSEVGENFFTVNGIEKGVMTLVDQKRQEQLLEELTKTNFNRACGGSAANTMIAIAQLGGKAFYSCKVANDEWGDFYKDDLELHSIHNNLDLDREEGVTGKCIVMVTPDADRTMNTFLGITEKFSEKEILEDELKEAEYLYIEGYLVASPTAQHASVTAREMAEKHGVKIALTFSDPNIVTHFKQQLNEVIGNKIDILFCNESEAKAFSDADNIKDAVTGCHKVAKTVVVTLGDKGALISDGDNQYQINAQPVNAIDTNGAGDIFAGSFLYGITHGMNLEKAGEFACLVAGTLVQSLGPRLTKTIMDQLKEEFR